jgi:PadR family transcriptional regulator, regulatory protein PadR
MQSRSGQLQSTLDLLVLRTLAVRGPLHGYAIVNHIQTVSEDDLRVEEGSLYPALHRMESGGWVDAEWKVSETNRRVKLYRITAAGRKQLARERESWERLSRAVAKVLRPA